jgi:UDP-N-acetylmuramoyl-L-alanyl-D-glutamate--2,6-diaminopimelate ligase
MRKRLSALIDNFNIKGIEGRLDNDVCGIAYDSRSVEKDFAFFALAGIHSDGHSYIESAVKKGASAIFVSRLPDVINTDISYILVDDTRKAMSFFASAFFDYPAKKLKIIGVTGTDGKSTTVSFMHQLLNKLGKKSGFISTVEFDCTGITEKNPYRQSTPEAPEIMQILSQMCENNFEYAVIESTSHGLSDRTSRLSEVSFNAGVLTNVTHEHLEFHGTMENYINDKANLFRKASDFCVVNLSEPAKDIFINSASSRVYSYALDNPDADIYAENISSSDAGSIFTVNYSGKKYRCRLLMPGIFNIENFLASAVTVSLITGTEIGNVLNHSSGLKPVTGRMDIIKMGQDFTVIVDYAHTPGAFNKIFPMIKQTVKNRLIAVFGSAGERDTGKRAIQGEIASRYSDILIITDEDPRGEDSMQIIDQIANGIIPEFDKSSLYKISDRQKAIDKAVEIAESGDTIILLGKGHESTIICKNGPVKWNERSAAEKALSSAGYKLSPYMRDRQPHLSCII